MPSIQKERHRMTGDALHFFYSVSLKLRYCATHTECGSYGSEDCRCQVPQKLNQPRLILLSHFSIFQYFNLSIFKSPEGLSTYS